MYDHRDYGALDFSTIIKKSSNIAMSKIVANLDPYDLIENFSRFSIAQPQYIAQMKSSGGYLPAGLRGAFAKAVFSFGYGLSSNLLQLAQAYAIIAHDGKMVPLHLLASSATVPASSQVLQSSVAKQILSYLKTTSQTGGTATRAKVQHISVAGKTGTAQVKKITEEERELELKTFEIPYEQRDHALYIAYGPYVNPRYALSIVVEHGGNGSTTAAPMAKRLFKLIIDRHEMRQSINQKKYLEI